MADASTGYFMGSHFLEQSLATLQNLKGVRDRRNATHAKLRTAQINTVEEMGEISHSSDITGLVNHYLQQIDGKNILDILMTMAMYAAPATRERIEASASKSVNDHPLSAMFASRSLDRRGRTVSIEPGATLNDALESGLTRTIIQAQDINLSLVVAAALDPAREALMEKGPVKFELILALCINSPFVPVDLQHIFAKGLHAFFQGDDAIAIAILAPLLEGGLRNLLEYAGELITTVDENGIEQAVTLSHILSQKRSTLDRIIGCRYSFAIEMLFDHTSGPKVRHRICHAIYFDADFYSKDSSYGCFLIFSLVMVTMGGHWRELKSHLESVLPHEWLRPIYVDLFAPRDNDAEARGSLDEVDVAAGGKAAESAQG